MSPGRALIISPRLPEFDRESGLLRVLHLIEMLVSRDWEVTFACLRTPTDPERYARELEQRGVETYVRLKRIDEIREPSEFNLAIVAFWHVAEQFLPQLRQAAPSARVVVDSVDLHFLREMRNTLRLDARQAGGQLEPSQLGQWAREISTYASSDAVLTVSAKEAALINDLTGSSDLARHLPDTEELPRSAVRIRQRRGILFLGNFLHAPNRDAAAYLCQEIVPRLDPELLAEHEILIVGTAAEEKIQDLAEGLRHVRVVGWVPSVLPYLNTARVSVVPLRYGAGTKRKVIQSLMVGTPTVTTTVGAEGLGVCDRREVLITDDPSEFASAIEQLLRRRLIWRRLARRGRKHVVGLHGRATVEAQFDHVLDSVLERPVRPATGESAGAERVVRSPAYTQLVRRVRTVVEAAAPPGAQVLVATRGDDQLLVFEGRRGWHFPREREGKYAGCYPADSEAATAHLEELRAQGATHLALPRTGFWWLAYYDGLFRHLDRNYRRIRTENEVILYDLTGRVSAPPSPPAMVRQRQLDANGSEGSAADRGEDQDPDRACAELTPDLVHSLQPSVVRAASRYRNGSKAGRALVLGIYLANKPNTAEHVAATLARSGDREVRQRWVALGGEPADGELGALTTLTVTEPTPKYTLLNRLLAEEDLASYDFVLTMDDDVVLPVGFLDLFLGVQAGVGFDLAQPARTLNSHVDHPIVLQQRGVVARRTLFVEIGPVVSFGHEIYHLVFPFDEANPMGWGFENVWSHRLREHGKSEGIVDAVPVDHSIRQPVAHYRWTDANADRDRYLARNPHLTYEECFKVLDIVAVDP